MTNQAQFSNEVLEEKQEELTQEVEESKKKRGPYYHAIYHGESGIQSRSFNTKKELQRHLKPLRPESIVGLFRGSKLHAAINVTTDYQII